MTSVRLGRRTSRVAARRKMEGPGAGTDEYSLLLIIIFPGRSDAMLQHGIALF
ncbi:MAG: hypothetical protein V3U52_01280 [Thermoplasmata archaeon]